MHDSRNPHSIEASTDELASPANPKLRPESAPAPPPEPPFDPPPLLSDCLGDILSERIEDAVEESFPPGSRKPRHDGFTPERIGDFLRSLATGVVEHAAAAAAEAPPDDRGAERSNALDPARLREWSDGELADAWTGGMLLDLPDEVWDRLAEQ